MDTNTREKTTTVAPTTVEVKRSYIESAIAALLATIPPEGVVKFRNILEHTVFGMKAYYASITVAELRPFVRVARFAVNEETGDASGYQRMQRLEKIRRGAKNILQNGRMYWSPIVLATTSPVLVNGTTIQLGDTLNIMDGQHRFCMASTAAMADSRIDLLTLNVDILPECPTDVQFDLFYGLNHTQTPMTSDERKYRESYLKGASVEKQRARSWVLDFKKAWSMGELVELNYDPKSEAGDKVTSGTLQTAFLNVQSEHEYGTKDARLKMPSLSIDAPIADMAKRTASYLDRVAKALYGRQVLIANGSNRDRLATQGSIVSTWIELMPLLERLSQERLGQVIKAWHTAVGHQSGEKAHTLAYPAGGNSLRSKLRYDVMNAYYKVQQLMAKVATPANPAEAQAAKDAATESKV